MLFASVYRTDSVFIEFVMQKYKEVKQDRHCMYNLTMRSVRANIVSVEKHIMSVCL